MCALCDSAPHGADPLGDGRLVDLLPDQRVCVAPVDVVGLDLGAAAVLGALPGDSHGRAVAAQQGDAKGSAGSGCDTTTQGKFIHMNVHVVVASCLQTDLMWASFSLGWFLSLPLRVMLMMSYCGDVHLCK